MINLQVGAVTAELKANPKPLLDALKQIETESVQLVGQLETRYSSVFKKIEQSVQSSQGRIENSARAHNNRLKSLVDSYSQKYKAAFQEMTTSSKGALDASSKELQELTADIKAATAELKQLVAEFKNVGTASGKMGAKRGTTTRMGMEGPKPDAAPLYEEMWNLPYRMEHIGRALYFSLSRPLQYAFGEMKNMVVAFEHSLLSTQAILGKSNSEFERFKNLAVQIASDGYGKIAEAAQVMEVLAKAGVDDKAILASTETLVNLGLAMDMAAGQAASMALQISSAFNKSITEIDYYADVLAKGTNNANMNLQDLLSGLSYVAPIAAAANTSLEETTALMGLLANSGIKGTKAGTALRNMFARLLNPSADMARMLEKYNITLKDTEGNFKSLVDVFKEFQSEGVSLTEVMKTFVQRAGPGVAKFVTSDLEALEEAIEGLYDARGELDKLINVKMSGVEGAMRKIESAKERIGKALFEKIFAEQIKQAATWMQHLAFAMENVSEETVKTIGYVLELAVAFGKVMLAIGVSKRTSKLLTDMSADFKKVFKTLAAGSIKFTSFFSKTNTGFTSLSKAVAKFGGSTAASVAAVVTLWTALLALAYKVNPQVQKSFDGIVSTTKSTTSEVIGWTSKLLGGFGAGMASLMGTAKNEASIFGEAFILWLQQTNAERAAQEEEAQKTSKSRWKQFTDYISERYRTMSIDVQEDFIELKDALLVTIDKISIGWGDAMVAMDSATGGMLTNAQNNINTFFTNTMSTLSKLWKAISLFDQRKQVIDKRTREEIHQATLMSPPEEPPNILGLRSSDYIKRVLPIDFSMGIDDTLSPEAESFRTDVAPYVGLKDAEAAKMKIIEKYARLKQQFYNVQDTGMLEIVEQWKTLELESIEKMGSGFGGGGGGGGSIDKTADKIKEASTDLYNKIFELTHTDTEVKKAQLYQQYQDYIEHTKDVEAATKWFNLSMQKLNQEYLEKYSASVAKGITGTLDLYLKASQTRIDQYYTAQLNWIDELEAASKQLYESQVQAEEELHTANMKRIDDYYKGILDSIELQRELNDALEEEESHYAAIREKVAKIHLKQNELQSMKDAADWEQIKLKYEKENDIYELLVQEQEALADLNMSRDEELAQLEEKKILLAENYALAKEEAELNKIRAYEDLAGVDNGSYLMQEYERFMRGTNLQFDPNASAFSASSIYDSIDNFLNRRASAFGIEVTDELRQSLFDQFIGMTQESPEAEYQKKLLELQQEEKTKQEQYETTKAKILADSLAAQNDIKQAVLRQAQMIATESAVQIAEKMNEIQDTEGEFVELNKILTKYLNDRKIDQLIENIQKEYDNASEEEIARSKEYLKQLGIDDATISAAYDRERMGVNAQKEVEEKGIENNALKIITDLPTEDLKAFLNEFMPDWETYGLTMGEKLMEGLQVGLENDDALLAKIRELAAKVLSEMKSELGIASPSKEAVRISEFYLQGLQKPMTRGSAAYGNLMSAIDSQARDMLSRYSSELERPQIGSTLADRMAASLAMAHSSFGSSPSTVQNDYRNQNRYNVTVHTHDDQVASELERTLRKVSRVFA